MYAGHFAAGLAIKAKVPAAPTWALLVGAGFLDVLFGPFWLLGIERATVTPHVSPGLSLDYIDWSHSLAMSVVWSLVYAAFFVRACGPRIASVMGLAVFSHFVLDLPMHPADLALWPGSAMHVGFGLWRSLPTGWWFIELVVIAVALAYYWQRARVERTFGGRAWAVALTVLVLHTINSPWLSAS